MCCCWLTRQKAPRTDKQSCSFSLGEEEFFARAGKLLGKAKLDGALFARGMSPGPSPELSSMSETPFPKDLLETIESLGLDPEAGTETLLPLLYRNLRALAHAKMAKLPAGQTLDPTALVHEVWMRLEAKLAQRESTPRGPKGWNDKGHFFAAAARSMRDILVEQARRKSRVKRGGDRQRVDLEMDALVMNLPGEELLGLDEALDLLEASHPRKAQVVQLRFFSALPSKEIAALLGITERTVERDWRFARAWLEIKLGEKHQENGKDG